MKRIVNDKRNYIIIGLCAVVLLMAVGYAAFASRLTINGTSEVTSTWNIRITNIKGVNDSSIPNNGAYDMKINEQDADVGPKIENTGLEAYFKTGLISPSDARIYEVEVTNLGSLDATVTPTLTGSSNPAIITRYDGVSSDTTGVNTTILTNAGVYTKASLSTGSTFDLDAGKKKYLYIYVQYNPAVESQPASLSASAQVVLNAVQKGSLSNSSTNANTNVVYSHSSGTFNIGDNISGMTTSNDYSSYNIYFLKHNIDDSGNITSQYICLRYDDNAAPVCIQSSGDYTSANTSLLQNNATVLENVEYSCSSTNSGYSCIKNTSNTVDYCTTSVRTEISESKVSVRTSHVCNTPIDPSNPKPPAPANMWTNTCSIGSSGSITCN